MTDTTSTAAEKTAVPVRELGMSPMVRIVGALILAAAAVYMAACAIYNMPSSPVKVRIVGGATAVIRPWFEQDWQLFAPTPSTDNAHIYVTALLRTADGKTVTSQAFDIQGPIEDLPKSSRLLPTKQPGITLAAQETFATYREQLQTIDVGAAPAARPALHAALDRRFAVEFDKLRRLLSEQAAVHFPGQQIVSVRAEFSQTPITPFSARGAAHYQAQSEQLLVTQWMPYAPDVSQP